MLDFTHKPLFSKPLHMGMGRLYLFDLIYLFILALVGFAFAPDFWDLNSGAPRISVSGHDFAALAVFGLYSVRISTFVAMARRNRQPQIIEWWIVILGMSSAVFLLVFGGFFLAPYAASHGYKDCYASGGAELFVKSSLPCPAPPAD